MKNFTLLIGPMATKQMISIITVCDEMDIDYEIDAIDIKEEGRKRKKNIKGRWIKNLEIKVMPLVKRKAKITGTEGKMAKALIPLIDKTFKIGKLKELIVKETGIHEATVKWAFARLKNSGCFQLVN